MHVLYYTNNHFIINYCYLLKIEFKKFKVTFCNCNDFVTNL